MRIKDGRHLLGGFVNGYIHGLVFFLILVLIDLLSHEEDDGPGFIEWDKQN